MADFTDEDKDFLDRLRKAFESTGQTTTLRAPWQEHFARDTSVEASRAVLAAKVLDGFSGSWAAQYEYGWGSTVTPTILGPAEPVAEIDPFGAPIPTRAKTSKIGQRGVPEINFVPYNWRTNALGAKGPSLVGHPISYEVIGPTLKSPFVTWTWRVDQGGGPNGGDLLTQDVQPDGLPPTITGDIIDLFGPALSTTGLTWTIGDPSEPNGGVYLLVSDDGANPGALDTAGGQVAMSALPLFLDTARFELFRVSAVTASNIEIHPNKSFSRIFDLPAAGTRYIRGITLLHPYVTRLAAIPGSGAGVGREQTFVVVSPERAASGDHYPPYVGGGVGNGSWLGGGFTEALAPGSGAAAGDPGQYGGKVRLPIPIPVTEGTGDVQSGLGLPPDGVGVWGIETPVAPFLISVFASELPIIRVSSTTRDEDLGPFIGFGNPSACLGWFEVLSTVVGPFTGVTVARVPEVNPKVALPYFGPGPFVVKAPGPTENLGLGFTLHQAVSELWRNQFDVDKVEACRLTTLIDPRWVRRFEKQVSSDVVVPPPAASGPGRPDKALWGTRAIAGLTPFLEADDPGNLMDLGFRMILFPAQGGVTVVPDFNRPITGREVVIDPSIAESQHLDIDYAGGVIRLSHPPPALGVGDIVPNGVPGGPSNPRGEVVLFAACVPYSMEPAQRGTGVRVTGDYGGSRDADVYSPQTFAQIDMTNTTFVGVAPFIGVSAFGVVEIVLDRVWFGPETGVVTITSGGPAGLPFGRWGYTNRVTRTIGAGYQVTALGGLSALAANLDPSPVGSQQRGVVLRREAVFAAQSLALPGVDAYVSDTAYGSSARAQTVRFRNARLFGELDGTLTVDPMPDFSLFEHMYGTAMPSKLEYPIGNVATATPSGNYLAEQGLLLNLDYQTAAGDPRFPDAGGVYGFRDAEAGVPAVTFSPAVIGADNWHGVITKGATTSPFVRGILHTSDNFRSVTKVTLQTRTAPDTHKFFIGFVQDDDPGVGFLDPAVGGVTNVAGLAVRFNVIALVLDQTVDNNLYFWTRGSGGDFFIPTGVIFTGATSLGPLYFVVETHAVPNPYRVGVGVTLTGGVEVRCGLYDVTMNLLASTVIADASRLPVPTNVGNQGRGLFYAAGTRLVFPSASFPALHFHGSTLVVDNGLPRIGPVRSVF